MSVVKSASTTMDGGSQSASNFNEPQAVPTPITIKQSSAPWIHDSSLDVDGIDSSARYHNGSSSHDQEHKIQEVDHPLLDTNYDVGKIESTQTTPDLSFSDLPCSDDEALRSPGSSMWDIQENFPPERLGDDEAAAHIVQILKESGTATHHQYYSHETIPGLYPDSSFKHYDYGSQSNLVPLPTPYVPLPNFNSLRFQPQHVTYSDYSDDMPRISRSAPCSPRSSPSLPGEYYRHHSAQPQLRMNMHRHHHLAQRLGQNVDYFSSSYHGHSSSSSPVSPYQRPNAVSNLRHRLAQDAYDEPVLPSLTSWIDETTSHTRKPKKQVLACFFCRERKIACPRPKEGSTETACSQCTRRGLSDRCAYPTSSLRGQHKRVRKVPEHRVTA